MPAKKDLGWYCYSSDSAASRLALSQASASDIPGAIKDYFGLRRQAVSS
jgi:hypothetical protein